MDNTHWTPWAMKIIENEVKMGWRAIGIDLQGIRERSWGKYDEIT